MDTPPDKKRLGIVNALIETFGFSPAVASVAAVFLALVTCLALIWVVRSAPPRTIVLTSGPEGSSFQRWAISYQKELAKNGVTLDIRPSGGALDNLQRLQAADSQIDVGFVPGGLVKDTDVSRLLSLGSVSYQPIWVFYRSSTPIKLLSELAGKRVAIGAPSSGTRSLALTLLQANGITGEPTTFSDLDAEAAGAGLMKGELDAVFLMGDSAPLQTLRNLTRAPEIQLYNFSQADAYVRRNAFLNRMVLPQGSFDFGKNLPAQDVLLVGPTVELIVREGLNSALADLLLEVGKTVHGRAGLLQKRGEFPAPLEHDIPLSKDALRYYKSGMGFFYRTISPFWLAGLLNRILVAVVPLLLIVVPAIRFLPLAFRLNIQLRLYRCYRPLLQVERETYEPLTPERVEGLSQRLDDIETTVNRLKVPASFADRFYWLRSHIGFVRQRLKSVVPV